MDDIFKLQDEITGKIVSALALKMSAPELSIITDKGTKKPLAHEAYLKGQAHLRLWTPDDLVAAIDLFEAALELDPDFSQAYTALAAAYRNNIVGGAEYFAKTGKEYFESKILLRHYINLSMENPSPETYDHLAVLELQRRNCFENNITIVPDIGVGSAFIAATYAFLGQEIKAKKALETWLSEYQGPYPDAQTFYIQYTFKDEEVFNRLVNGLIKAGWEADPKAYYPIQKENKLDGPEISTLVLGKTTSGNLFGSYEWSTSISDDGNAMSTNNMGGTAEKGKIWIESDLLCYQWEKRWGSIKYCCDIYRNKKGDKISKSEYLLMGDFWTIPFSVFE